MKKIFLLILGFVMFKVGYSQYPIQQFIGADSAVVTSKGGLQGRFINVVFADTTAANSQRVRQYPGAMIYASGKLWVRNTTATAWNELAYNITPVNIYNSNGSLTSNRTLDGDGYSLTFDQIGGEFGVGADSINFNPASGKFRISTLNQGIGTRALRYNPVTKLITYSDTTSSVNIYNSDGTLTGNRELDGDGKNLSFVAVKNFIVDGDTANFLQDQNIGVFKAKAGTQEFILSDSLARFIRTNNAGVLINSTNGSARLILNPQGPVDEKKFEVVANNEEFWIAQVNDNETIRDTVLFVNNARNVGIGITNNVDSTLTVGGGIHSRGGLRIDNLPTSPGTKALRINANGVVSAIDTINNPGTVTSVGLSMPTAFAVANSPVTSSGTLTVTGAGVASQYIRGDGQLATLPTTGGGGSSVSYYLNGSVNQGTFAGTPYYEMSKTAIFGAGTDFNISSNGYIASFITDAGDPSLLNIPAGNWDFEVYFQSSSTSGTPSFYVELYKYDGSTFTLIASSSSNPEFITGGTSVDAYYTPLAVPSTSLLVTDRLAVRIYVNNSGNTITLHTEDNNLCQIITTFSTGINALNGLTSQVQYLATGTSGTDFNISSLTDTHTFNLPVASATNTGKLSSTNWSTFNSKIGPSDTASMLSPYLRKVDTTAMLSPYKTFYPRTAISLTTTGTSGAATYDNSTGVLNVPQYADQFTGTVTSVATNTATGITGGTITTTGTLAIDTNLISTRAWRQKGIDSVASLANSKIDGSGTTNYVAKFTASGTIGNSQIFDNGTDVGFNTASPSTYLAGIGGNVIFRSGTSVGQSIATGSNNYVLNYLTASNQYIWYPLPSGTRAGTLFTNTGNWVFGTGSTDGGFKVDIGGTLRASGDAKINGLTVGKGNSSVSENTAFGVNALVSNTTGSAVTAVGYLAGNANGSSNHNTYIGTRTGISATGANNTFVGSLAGFSNTTGNQNTFLGTFAGYDVTTGISNTFVGYLNPGITTGNYNTIIGANVTGLSSSLSNTIILADGQGNQRLYIDNNGYAKFTSATTTSFIQALVSATTFAALYLDQTTPSLTNYAIASDGTNTLVNAASTSVNLRVGNSDRAVVYSNGNLSSGTLPADIGFSLNLTSAGSSGLIRAGNFTYGVGGRFVHFNYGDETQTSSNYSIYYESGDLIFNTKTGGVFKYRINNTDVGRIFTNGNFFIGSSPTDAGFKLDVNGTARVKEYLYLLRSDAATTIAALTYQAGNTIDIGNTFRVLGTNKWQNTVGSASYIENNYFTKVFASVPQTNGSWTMYDFQLFSSMAPTIASSYNQKVIGTAFTIQSTAVNSFFGVDVRATDNSASIANNVYAVYADATLGTNTSATRWAGYFVGRISNTLGATFATSSGNVLIGTTTDAGQKLQISGGAAITAVFENSGTNAGLRISNSTYPYLVLNRSGTINRAFGIFNASGDIAIQESATWSGAYYHIFYGTGGYSTTGSGHFGNNVAANASAVLEATSTTKGFLPPRMTGAQAEAIATPATGLMVYANNGNGATITSTGWWGYNGTTWVKLN